MRSCEERGTKRRAETFSNSSLQQIAHQDVNNPNTGTIRENKKVKDALKNLGGLLDTVQAELGRQTNLAKLAQASKMGARRSKLYYGNVIDKDEQHRQRFFVLRSLLTFISCVPSPLLIFFGALGGDEKYYRMAVAAWPIEALFVLLHFVITVERSTREPNPEEKVHYVAHYICHWMSVIVYLSLNPGVTSLPPVIGMMILTSSPLYYTLKQVRAAIQQYHLLKGDIGKYVDEVFILLLGVLVPQLYLFFEQLSSYSGEDSAVGFNANLCINIHLLELGLFDIAVLGEKRRGAKRRNRLQHATNLHSS